LEAVQKSISPILVSFVCAAYYRRYLISQLLS